MKEVLFAYASPEGVVTGRRQIFLRGCNMLLSVIWKESRRPTFRADFPKTNVILDLNWLHTAKTSPGRLDGKEISALYIVLPILGAFVYEANDKERDYAERCLLRCFSSLKSG